MNSMNHEVMHIMNGQQSGSNLYLSFLLWDVPRNLIGQVNELEKSIKLASPSLTE